VGPRSATTSPATAFVREQALDLSYPMFGAGLEVMSTAHRHHMFGWHSLYM
jgi:hypothetical protein